VKKDDDLGLSTANYCVFSPREIVRLSVEVRTNQKIAAERMVLKQKKQTLNWDVDETKVLTDSQRRTLRRSCRDHKEKALKAGRTTEVKDWFVVMTGLETGLRVDEMAKLVVSDLQMKSGHKSVRVRCGKGGRRRVVVVRRAFVEMANEFLEWKGKQGESLSDDAPVFSTKGRPMTCRGLQKAYDRSRRRAGVVQEKGVGIHSLRHTFATNLLSGTRNIRFVQRQLGHASVRTTEIYSHILDALMLIEKLYVKRPISRC